MHQPQLTAHFLVWTLHTTGAICYVGGHFAYALLTPT